MDAEIDREIQKGYNRQALIDKKVDLIEQWLDPKALEFIQNFYAAKKQFKGTPVVYYITDISDPIGIRHNGEYHLMYTFSLVY
ncbi:hypothetical protein HZS_6480, partial [Henneguya salminicola]